MNRQSYLSFGRWASVSGLLAVALGLGGCGMGEQAASSPVTSSLGDIKGMVYGGQQPVVGAKVYLYAAGATGYGGAGLAASPSNASVSLLTNVPGKTTSDGTNYYVTTDSLGTFLLTGDYTCTSGQQVYVYVVGGNPGGGTNTAVGMMAILGQCPVAGNLAATVPFVWVNEVSTIAAAYSFAGFATDPTHVSSSSTNATGIANAFASAANLVNVGTGTARTAPTGNNGTVPNLEINTLANIISDCINSTGSASAQCTTLFNNAKSAGLSGTAPTDTATAAINIAHYPGVSSAQVTALYGLQAGVATPFNSHLTSQPNDFTIVVKYTGGGLADPWAIATDASGNVWVGNSNNFTVTGLNSKGAFLTGSSGYSNSGVVGASNAIAVDLSGNVWDVENAASPGGGFGGLTKLTVSNGTVTGSTLVPGTCTASPGAVSIDASNNVWVLNLDSISKFTNAGASTFCQLSSGANGLSTGAFSIANDNAGNAWVAGYNGNDLAKFNSSGVAQSGTTGYTTGSPQGPYGVALDSHGNIWTANYGNSSLTKFTSAGAGTNVSGGGITGPYGLAIDGANNIFVLDNLARMGLSEFSFDGTTATALTSSTGYQGGTTHSTPFKSFGGLYALALDISGNVWIANYDDDAVIEYVGAAVPVVMPLAQAVKNNTLATRP